MEFRDLTPHGWPDYKVREDGVIQTPRGRWTEVDGNGQVNLKDSKGRCKNHKIAVLVAIAFLPPKEDPDLKYVVFKDGDRNNTHYTNLVWSKKRMRIAEKREDIIVAATQGLGLEDIAMQCGVSQPYVRKVLKERLAELEARGI